MVSVGIPTYNRASTLKRSVESVLSQGYSNIEVVICDNASSDNTGDYCNEIAAKHPHVKYYRAATNRGPTANFVECLRRSQGEFFMWLADDDWIDSNFVSDCVEVLKTDRKVVLVGGLANYYQRTHFVRSGSPVTLLGENRFLRMVRYYFATRGNNEIFYGVMRREAAIQIPIRNSFLNDLVFVANLAYQGTIKTISSAAIHRETEGATTSGGTKRTAKILGLSLFCAYFPYLTAGATQFKDVLSGDTPVAKEPFATKLALAVGLFLVVAIGRWAFTRWMYLERNIFPKIGIHPPCHNGNP